MIFRYFLEFTGKSQYIYSIARQAISMFLPRISSLYVDEPTLLLMLLNQLSLKWGKSSPSINDFHICFARIEISFQQNQSALDQK